MDRPSEDDRVRIDNPETDPDHDSYHSEHGTVVATSEDDTGTLLGDEREGAIYRVEPDSDKCVDFQWCDLRPLICSVND
ncbi:MAG: hypothetical protein ABEH88_06235 [Halobacteriales archaeon]